MISSDTETIQGKSVSIQCRCNLPLKTLLQYTTIDKLDVLNDIVTVKSKGNDSCSEDLE